VPALVRGVLLLVLVLVVLVLVEGTALFFDGPPRTRTSAKSQTHLSIFFVVLKKKSTNISMSGFPRLFVCFIAFSGVSQRREFKTPQKTFYKEIVYKTTDKKSKTGFSRFVLMD
jgi:hypothetical protein